MPKPIVAIVGRPSVGKSTLFNRLVGQRLAIVGDMPGTTRDRLYASGEWRGATFTLIDTGGLQVGATDDLVAQVQAQARIAIAEADVIVFMTDVMEGVTAGDEEIVPILHRSRKPVILAANKADNQQLRLEAMEFYRLGLGEPLPISALHGTGTGDLLDKIVESLPAQVAEEEVKAIKVAIVGRPNVGKSSLLNAILGWERAIVHEEPGTTRDALDTLIEWGGEPVVLIDMAGIRRRGRIAPGVERYSVLRALRAIDRADVALLLIDAVEGVTDQDAHIASYILEEAKGVVIVVNKWDLIVKDAHTVDWYTQHIRESLKFIPYAPLLFVSAKTKEGVDQVLEVALRVREERLRRIPTGELNRMVSEAVARHAPPSKAGKRLKLYYVTQAEVDPPTFVFFVNDKRLVHFSYERYLENRLREHYGFLGTPLRLSFRKRGKSAAQG